MIFWLENLWLNRPSACRRRREATARARARFGLSESDVSELARYNTDRWRGVVFDLATVERMRDVQARYDQAERFRAEEAGEVWIQP